MMNNTLHNDKELEKKTKKMSMDRVETNTA